MYFLRVLSVILIFSFSLIYLSCDIITETGSTVTGKVYSYEHIPVSNVRVTCGNQSVKTSEDGSFTINDLTYPYDLIVSDSLYGYATIFKGLSTGNVSLPLKNTGFISGQFINIHVKIPFRIFQPNTEGKIYFTDGNYMSSYSEISKYDTGAALELYTSEPVEGKLILLTYKKDNSGKIVSYENFGESKSLEFHPGVMNNYRFDSTDISLNPGEQTVTGSFQYPPGSYTSYANFYLNFSAKNSFSYARICEIGSNIFNFIIPTGLPSEYTAHIKNDSYGGTSGYSSEDFIVYPDIPNRPEVKQAPAIISPGNNITIVNNNTEFSFTEGTGSGIYIVSLYNRNKNVMYRIVTSNTSFTLAQLEGMGFGRINNNAFYWDVVKTGPVSSINDYVTDFFNKGTNFSSGTATMEFLTEP